MAVSLSDFNNLSSTDKKNTLESLKKEIGVGGMVKEWGISRSKVYSMLHEFDIAVNSRKHKLKPQKPGKNPVSKTSDPAREVISSSAADQAGLPAAVRSSADLTGRGDSSKFSLYLETQGTAAFINETVQLLLGSQKFTDSNLLVNISLQEV